MQALKRDCLMKAESSARYIDKTTAELIDKLRELMADMKTRQKQIAESWRNAVLKFGTKKSSLEELRTAYINNHQALDSSIANYEQSKNEKGTSADQKKKWLQRITLALQKARDSDKDYTNVFYEAKNARLEYIKTAVLLSP